MTSSALPPAGWYADTAPGAPQGQLRYWDGRQWTEATGHDPAQAGVGAGGSAPASAVGAAGTGGWNPHATGSGQARENGGTAAAGGGFGSPGGGFGSPGGQQGGGAAAPGSWSAGSEPGTAARRVGASTALPDTGVAAAPIAGFGSRAAGLVIDWLAVGAVTFMTGLGLGFFAGFFGLPERWLVGADLLWQLIDLAIAITYFSILHAEGRRTAGKAVAGTVVVDATTRQPIPLGKSVGRAFGMLLSALPMALGYLWAAWDPNRQTWHDKIAGTVVVKTRADGRAVAAQNAFANGTSEPLPSPGQGWSRDANPTRSF